MAGIYAPKSFILLSMFLSFVFLPNQGATGCDEPAAAPAPSPPWACESCELAEDPWPEVRREGDGCDLIIEGCNNWTCGYFTCEDYCPVSGTREQGCVWDEGRMKYRCVCR